MCFVEVIRGQSNGSNYLKFSHTHICNSNPVRKTQ